jgi:hypothetical protein
MKLKYFLEKFEWMKVYFSPFKPPVPKLYIGKIAIGTPYFFPRVWKKTKDKTGYLIASPKKIGFDFVDLGWKAKWTSTDYRFEWNPVWSFVFFGYQIAITFVSIEPHHYWECWLYYSRETKGTPKERLEQAKKGFPCVWVSRKDGVETETCYWDVILKNYNYD